MARRCWTLIRRPRKKSRARSLPRTAASATGRRSPSTGGRREPRLAQLRDRLSSEACRGQAAAGNREPMHAGSRAPDQRSWNSVSPQRRRTSSQRRRTSGELRRRQSPDQVEVNLNAITPPRPSRPVIFDSVKARCAWQAGQGKDHPTALAMARRVKAMVRGSWQAHCIVRHSTYRAHNSSLRRSRRNGIGGRNTRRRGSRGWRSRNQPVACRPVFAARQGARGQGCSKIHAGPLPVALDLRAAFCIEVGVHQGHVSASHRRGIGQSRARPCGLIAR